MSSIYFEKGRAREVIAPSRKRCYRCVWRGSKYEEFSCRYALEHPYETVLGTMKAQGLPAGAPCPCFTNDERVKTRKDSTVQKAIKEDVRRAETVMTEAQKEKERRRIEADARRKEKHEARMALYNAGYSDGVIARALGCAKDTIVAWRHKNNLPANYTKGGKPVPR